MQDVTIFRLYLLRVLYLFIGIGLAATIWPQLLHHPTPWPLWHGVGCSLLGAVSVLAFLGIRYPLKMLPLLFFEMTWKIIWLLAIGLPLWASAQMDAVNLETAQNCLVAGIIPFVVPWKYVFAQYVKMPGDRWK